MPAATPLDIRRKIRSVQKTQQITKAMKMVAAARLRRAETKMRAERPYSATMNDFVRQMLPSLAAASEENPLLHARPAKAVGVIVITADRGLCGAFNANIIRRAEELMKERPDLAYVLFCLGRKGAYYFLRRHRNVRSEYTDLYRSASLPMAAAIIQQAASSYLEGRIDELQLVHASFRNVAVHPVVTRTLLPLKIETVFGEQPPPAGQMQEDAHFEFEPDIFYLGEVLLEKYISHELYHALLESFASELGARMTAMDSATNNAQEVVEMLTLEYNNLRQASITREIVEIASTAEAMK